VGKLTRDEHEHSRPFQWSHHVNMCSACLKSIPSVQAGVFFCQQGCICYHTAAPPAASQQARACASNLVWASGVAST
jgi:hypothetical protein